MVFGNGENDLNDKPRSGRPREIDRNAVIETIDLDPTLSTEDLADDFECTQQQIRNILKHGAKADRFHMLSVQVKCVSAKQLLNVCFVAKLVLYS